jgi:hypothetical protein
MADRSSAHDDDAPSLRQQFHAATGDRHKEAEALAERSADDVDVDDAEVAVRRAHGDIDGDQAPESAPKRAVASDLASATDAEHVRDEESPPAR